jgi:hypothetical protein
MAYKRKGQLASSQSARRHYRKRTKCKNRKFIHQHFWHRERFAEKSYIASELQEDS